MTVGGVANTSYIARWNGSVWSALGTGMNGSVTALAVSGTNLYAGGSFTIAGGMTVNRIAKWNGAVWSALGTGMNSNVSALAVNGANVYAGGSFTTADGVSAQRIAKWNGGNWSALGTGMGGFTSPFVSALAVSGTDLYAGGYFTTAGGMSANHIAKWNGSAWTALGTGVYANLGNNPPVKALAVSGSDLYVGGAFSSAGGVESSWCIAKWNGSAWTALGTGLIKNKEYVYALAVDSFGNLFAGGDFRIVDGVTVNRIAKWNSNAWTALGTGMNARVSSLMTDTSNHLFVGGNFTLAGTTSSPYIAQANIPVPAPEIAVKQANVLTDAVSNINFGTVNTGSGSVVKTFTITNTGDANLSSLVVNKTGTNAGDFVVSALSGTSIAVGSGTVTFTVTFSPTAGSSWRTGALHIASNVTGSQNTFDIALTGMANNAPTDVGLSVTSVAENVAANTTVGTLSSSDPDLGDTCSYSLVSGSGDLDNTAFTITSAALSINITPVIAAKSSYAIRLRATDSGGLFCEKAFIINIVDVMEFPEWASSFSLIEADAEPGATPFNDGIENLLKYAFNMNATGPDVRVLMVGGYVGLPMIALDSSGSQPVLRVEFLRRRGSGLIYIPQRSNTLGDFVAMTGTPTVTAIDAEWERVSVEESAPPATAPNAFARVEVSLP